ncbi:HigA family addiction module antitoxin [Nitrospirillum bahiense]|uniref:Addiction module HigA family antidote n=1 Tax=Nitrospirillum amazonense TaxID=28077 RepID=A0A560G713_9PROT|nr:HigA family addiction module antitoxin [Nitrospirillum amazonense]TWB29658.1 addiction module HigA family antidote [Nitrospirillum amazonense]
MRTYSPTSKDTIIANAFIRPLREEFMKPLCLSAGEVAKACDVPRTRIECIVNEEIKLTIDTAFRVAKCFNTSVELWLNLQTSYDLAKARRSPPNLDAVKVLHAAK